MRCGDVVGDELRLVGDDEAVTQDTEAGVAEHEFEFQAEPNGKPRGARRDRLRKIVQLDDGKDRFSHDPLPGFSFNPVPKV